MSTEELIAGSFGLIYLATPTSDYFWDGITFALQIEKVARGERGFGLLLHQSHLLYDVFGYLIYASAHAMGMTIRALVLLQIANAFIAGAGVRLLFVMLRRLTRSDYTAAVCSAGLGFSAIWWKLATDADAYIISVFLLLVCANNLLGRRPTWYVAGLALAGAMLFHELASLFSLAAMVLALSSGHIQFRRGFAARMIGLAWSVAVGVYYASAALLLGITQPFEVVRWSTTNPSLISPSLNPVPGILQTPRANLDLVLGHSLTLFWSQAAWVEYAIAAAAIILSGAVVVTVARKTLIVKVIKSLYRPAPEMSEPWKQTVPALAVWISTYLVFLLFFEPQDPYLRLFYAPALAVFFGLVLSNLHCAGAQADDISPHRQVVKRPAAIGAAAFALFNLAFFIAPHMRGASNPLVTAARNASNVWNEQTVIYFAARTEADTTFEYFNAKTRWRSLKAAAGGDLDTEVEAAYSRGGSVWVNTGAATLLGDSALARFDHGRELRVQVGSSPAYYLELRPIADSQAVTRRRVPQLMTGR